MNIVVRAFSIGVLAVLLSFIPWWLARSVDAFTILLFALPVTVVVAPLFVAAAIVQMFVRQRRRQVGDGKDAYRYRVRRHYLTWFVLTVIAGLVVWGALGVLLPRINITDQANVLVSIVIVVPTLLLGMISSSVIEHIHERVLERRIVKD